MASLALLLFRCSVVHQEKTVLPVEAIQTIKDRKVRCLLFDCGETLWTSIAKEQQQRLNQEANQRTITLLQRWLPNETTNNLMDEAWGQQLRMLVMEETYRLQQQDTYCEPDFVLPVQHALHTLQLPKLTGEQCLQIFEALRPDFDASRVLFPDTHTTLTELKKRGFALGVVTNRHWGGKPFMDGMHEMGLLTYFVPEQMAISADLGIRKPNPEIFLYTLRAMGMAPEETIMVGDSLHADIAGAQKLNMLTAWMPKQKLYQQLRTQTGRSILNSTDLLDAAYTHEQQRYQLTTTAQIVPDLVIEHLHELLAIFTEVEYKSDTQSTQASL